MVGLPSHAVTTMTMMTTTTTTTTTSMTTTAAQDMDPRAVSSSGKVRSLAAKKMAKQRRVKPSVDKILNVGNIKLQAALLRALADHPALAPAVKLAGIATSRAMAAAEFVCAQLAQMMDRARSGEKLRGNTHKQKRDAAEVMLTFTASSPVRKAGDPSRHDRACALGVPQSTLDCVDKQMIEKRKLLSAEEMGIHWWALAKKKKGYTTISDELKLLLVNEFNNHPQVIVSPNSKDRLQTKNATSLQAHFSNEGSVQWDPSPLQLAHGFRPRSGMGGSSSCCLQLWTMQGAAPDAMGPTSRLPRTATLVSE